MTCRRERLQRTKKENKKKNRSQKLVAFALPVGLNILNLQPSIASLLELSTMDSSNRYRTHLTPELSFEITLHGNISTVSKITHHFSTGILLVVSGLHATAAALMSIKYFDNSFNNDQQSRPMFMSSCGYKHWPASAGRTGEAKSRIFGLFLTGYLE
ncbi:hypothetical protein AAHA92_02795 [Salvia divinorum]|uniref:NADH-plastoquinone oxidoreductase subunit 5 n=1 Tax=Salvia divinorum TaxID=28513 RepID=A0ABD1IHL2_SALDI